MSTWNRTVDGKVTWKLRLWSIAFYFHYFCEHILSKYLVYARKDDYFLTEEKCKFIIECAQKAYGDKTDLIYDDYDSIDEWVRYNFSCSGIGQIYVFNNDVVNVIMIRHLTHYRIDEFASKEIGNLCWINLLISLKQICKNKLIKAKCRETTSYKLIKILEKKNIIKVYADSSLRSCSELCHEVAFKIIKL